MTQQIETATIVGTITGSGNVSIVVTALGLLNSPKTFSVPVLITDTASVVANKAAKILALDIDIQNFFYVTTTGANIALTARSSATNDATMNIASDNDTCTGLTPEPTSFATQAGSVSPPIDGYCTVADLKNYPVLQWPAGNVTSDQLFANIITAISREIDKFCGRFFYQLSETKYYTPSDVSIVIVDDLVSVSTLATDELNGSRTYPFTWSTTDYDLLPYDAAQRSEPEPYTAIGVTPQGAYMFPCVPYWYYDAYRFNHYASRPITKGVRITGVFGWPEVPSAVSQACLLWSYKTFKNYQTPYTDMNMADGKVAFIPIIDNEVAGLLRNYRRLMYG